jgi:hypothetical protein
MLCGLFGGGGGGGMRWWCEADLRVRQRNKRMNARMRGGEVDENGGYEKWEKTLRE